MTFKETNLRSALDHALRIIENYEMDIRDTKEFFEVDLVEAGFCQGGMYKTARQLIEKVARGERKL